MAIIGRLTKLCETEYETDFEWEIEDVFTLLKDSFYYSSPAFPSSGNSWCLQIDSYDSPNDIRLFLCKEESESKIGVMYKFGLRLKDGKTEMRCCLIRHFDDSNPSFGTLEFISVSELEERKHELLPSGVLTVACSVGLLNAVPKIQMVTYQDLDSLSHNFKDLFNSHVNIDVTIMVGEQAFPAHKAILTARTPVFAALLRSEMEGKLSGIINVDDCDPIHFKEFLSYVYSGKAENLSESNACHLYKIADKYDVQDLKSICTTFIKRNISLANFYDVVIFANKYGETAVMSAAQVIFNGNVLTIIKSDEWEQFLKQNFTMANEFLIRLFEKVKIED